MAIGKNIRFNGDGLADDSLNWESTSVDFRGDAFDNGP